MSTVVIVLVSLTVYGVVILGFLRFFGYLNDRDAEIRQLLAQRRSRKRFRQPIQRRGLKLAR